MPAPQTREEQDRLLAMFKALADGTRLQIFRLIAAQRTPICACEIVDRFDVSRRQSRITRRSCAKQG
jgi:DNA-binding transcriptional ArsR family regulator